MKLLELYDRVRYAGRIEGISRREAARRFGIDPRTVAKMLAISVPPGYRPSRPPARPKLDAFVGTIDGILEPDKGRPSKQRHMQGLLFDRVSGVALRPRLVIQQSRREWVVRLCRVLNFFNSRA